MFSLRFRVKKPSYHGHSDGTTESFGITELGEGVCINCMKWVLLSSHKEDFYRKNTKEINQDIISIAMSNLRKAWRYTAD